MHSRMAFVLPLFLVTLAACATNTSQQPTTPVIASDIDREWFGGTWRGEVESSDARFAGSVEFRFLPDGAVIVPTHGAPSRILWVKLDGSRISGALAPYFDASRSAEVYTTFEGSLSAGSLRGTLRERTNLEWKEVATWNVSRLESAAMAQP